MGEGTLDARKRVLLVVVAFIVASLSVVVAQSPQAAAPVASAPSVKASAATPYIWYNYSDFFDVPYGEWWDMRTSLYGDEPIGASCFNATAAADGTCTTRVNGLPVAAPWPYENWAGPGTAAAVYAPYRAAIAGYSIPGYNLSQPVFLPVFNYSAAPGNTLSFNWNMQYLDTAQFNALTSAPLNCFSGNTNKDDGYQLLNKIYLTLDNQEAARLFGAQISSSQSTIQAWWNNRVNSGACGSSTTGKNPPAGPVEAAVNSWFNYEASVKYNIYNGYDGNYTSLYTNMSVKVLTGGPAGLTQIYIEHGAWGTETLLDRWFYWGNATYAGNQADSSKARGWWGMENGWWEDLHYAGKLQATTMNFNLTGVLQYDFQEHSTPGPDGCLRQETTCTEAAPSDDTPYWTWGPMLLDYVYVPNKSPYSEITRYSGLGYVKTTPGSGDYGTNTSFDYTPISWAAKAGEYWNFEFPTNSSAFYQDPATAVIGTSLPTAQLPPLASRLSFMQTFPAGYGTWTASTGTWSVVGGTPESWPPGTPTGGYPYLPYGAIYLQPANIPPSVTTNPATSITGTSAQLNGYLGSLGSASSVDVGFLWGTSPTLVGATNTTPVTETATGPFASVIGSLTTGVTYYFEAWANAPGLRFVHGSIKSFNTGATPPSVTTVGATGVTTSGATLNGNLASLGTASSVTVGFLYGTSPTLASAQNTTPVAQSSLGPFTHALSTLTPGTKYYFEAWAAGAGFANGSVMNFTTATTYPAVVTDPATAIINTGATLNGRVTNFGLAASVTVGFLWGTSATLVGATNTTPVAQAAPGPFTVGLSTLTPGTKYYYEAWANGTGFGHGAVLSFTTGGSAPPTVATSAASGVTSSAATLNGATSSLGGATAVEVGFYWSTSSTLAGANNVSAGTQTAAGSFTHGLSALVASTTYYFEAWANGTGFATGAPTSFTTLAAAPTPPSVTSVPASGVTTSGATLNGNVATLGSATSVTVGFLWGTSATLVGATNTTPVAQTTTGSFSAVLTGLTPGTTYYFEAWVNGSGFAHGAIESFATPASSTSTSQPTFLGLPILVGYAVLAAIVVVVLVAVVVALLLVQRKKSPPPLMPPPVTPPGNP